jgi:DNA-directed RNA polymerase subunit M/transcription elongation factor TFIIS
MAVIEFVQNYSDLSTDQGYQFKFHCDRCGNGYMSTYQANKLEAAESFLKAAGGLFGGVLGRVSDSAYDIQRAVGGPQHDRALQAAVQEIKPLFTQCRRCGTWVCHQVCWNDEKGLCKACAPILAEEMASAQATAMRSQIQEKAYASDQTQSANVSIPTTARCPQCSAATAGGKFCPECGAALNTKATCSSCQAEIPAGSKFCSECGTRA